MPDLVCVNLPPISPPIFDQIQNLKSDSPCMGVTIYFLFKNLGFTKTICMHLCGPPELRFRSETICASLYRSQKMPRIRKYLTRFKRFGLQKLGFIRIIRKPCDPWWGKFPNPKVLVHRANGGVNTGGGVKNLST